MATTSTEADYGRLSWHDWPRSGEIAFDAVGFRQTLRTEPVVIDGQSPSHRARQRMTEPPPMPLT